MTNAGGRADGRDRKGLAKELAAVLDLGGQSSPRGQMSRNRRPVQRCGGVRCPADSPRHEAGHSCVEALKRTATLARVACSPEETLPHQK